jgi:hypothetical protein
MKQRPYPMSLLMIGQIAAGSVLFALAVVAWSSRVWSLEHGGLSALVVVLATSLLCFCGAFLASLGSRYTIVTGVGVVACTLWFFLAGVPIGISDSGVSLQNLILAVCFLVSVLQGALLFPGSLRVLAEPERRWWLQSERKSLVVPVVLNAGDVSLQLVSYDASETGLFLCKSPTGVDQAQVFARLVERGDPVELQLQGEAGHSPFSLEAEVSRIQTRAEGGYPVGIGVRLVTTEGANHERYLALLRDLRGVSAQQVPSKHRR